ncbi:MAG: polysaccharide biosynthesis protein [Ruminococcaceae bacterium]|nr:polysaccharide biosynthesis protein [Oscillospiraceae bacterium]
MKNSMQIKIGSLLSYLQMGVNILIGLLYTPIMIRMLGSSEYGLYNTVSSTIAMLSILNLGFNASYIRYFSKYKKKNDEESISKLNGLYIIIFMVIGFVGFICGLFLSFNLNLVFDQGLTAAEYETARVLMLLFTVNLTISFPMSVFQSIISAHEKYVFLKSVGILRTVFSPLLTLPLLLLGYRSIAMITVTICVSIVADIAYLIYSKKFLKISFKFSGFESGLFKSMLIFTSFIAINLIVDQVNNNMGKFLLGRYMGTTAVAVYSVGYTLYQYYTLFSSTISGVFAPRIHRIVNETNEDVNKMKQNLTELFSKVGRIQFLILSLISSGLIFFGKPFISFWAGEEYAESYYVAILLIIPSSIALIQNLGLEIQRAQNKHKFRSLAYVIMALINLSLTVFLCQKFGATGAAIGTAASFVIANGFIMNIYYHKKCNINIIYFWKSILKMSRGLVLPVVFGTGINILVDFNGATWKMFAGILGYAMIYVVSMWFFGMNQYEKSLLIDFTGKMVNVFRRHKR